MILHVELQCITETGLTGMIESFVNIISMTSGNSTIGDGPEDEQADFQQK